MKVRYGPPRGSVTFTDEELETIRRVAADDELKMSIFACALLQLSDDESDKSE